MFARLAAAIFGTSNDRALKRYQSRVPAINALEPRLQALSDEALTGQTALLRERLAKGETLDALLPEAFATVREASRRVLGLRHFDVQMIGGMVLHEGKIAEMKTGEGKTLVATLPVYLNALPAKGVHVVTVNDYLAKRDAEWMGRVYGFLGLSVGVIVNGLSDDQRQAAYACDVTYGTNNEYGFDYLRDNMKYRLEDMAQRDFAYAIVDEVDSILVDEARTPLIISGPTDDTSDLYRRTDEVMKELVKDKETFEKDEKQRAVSLTELGGERVEELLRQFGLLTEGNMYDTENVSLVHHVNQALRAHTLFARDVEYIVRQDKIIIIDEFTGRMMEGRRYSDGLHQALEAKEHVTVQPENQTLASITFQNYFRLYPKLAGMTGTAATEADELAEIYKLEVVEIPTNVPVARLDQDDEVYRNAEEKYEAVAKLIEEARGRGQPCLVGTTSIEKSELISTLLKKKNIPHQVLNARYHEQEATIISQAGRAGAVTIATNMAGRGTDIVLGGNIEKSVSIIEADEALSEDDKTKKIQEIRSAWQTDHEKVKSLGGLRIIATERHESRRIDNQLRGRSGRQGDPGSSRFYLSLDDSLMRIFAGERVKAIMERLQMPEGEAIEAGMVTRSIETAQRKVEARNFDIRKQLLEYDDVSNDQRKVIYQQRNDILDAQDLRFQIQSLREGCFTDLVHQFVPPESVEEQWDLPGLEKALLNEWHLSVALSQLVQDAQAITDEDIVNTVVAAANQRFDEKIDKVGAEQFTPFMRAVLLQNIDSHWREHLSSLDYLRQGIHLRGYAQKQPKQEYKREAFELFGQLLDMVKNEVTRVLMTVQIESTEQVQLAADQLEEKAEAISNITYSAPDETGAAHVFADNAQEAQNAVPAVGRNEACPCGSGKKYKHCHGKLA
jgi:preprotein translocase subunit SecA